MRFQSGAQAAEALAAHKPSVRPTLQWIDSLVISGVNTEAQILAEFLITDIELSSAPHDALTMVERRPTHVIDAPFVVQLDEVVDVSIRERERMNFAIGRTPTFKVMLSNAGLPLVGVLQQPIPGISLDSVGVKLELAAGTVCHYGVLLLSPENTAVLGGTSERMLERRNAFVAERRESEARLSFYSSVDSASRRIPEAFLSVSPQLTFVYPEVQLSQPIAPPAPPPPRPRAGLALSQPFPPPREERPPPDPPAAFTQAKSEWRAPLSQAKSEWGAPLAQAKSEWGPPPGSQRDVKPDVRPQPAFRPTPPPRRPDGPLDLHALQALPEVHQVRMLGVNASVFCLVDFVCGPESCSCSANLDGQVLISVKASLITAMMECDPADYRQLPADIQHEFVVKCEQRLIQLAQPLVVIDQGSGPVLTRFVLTSGAHETDAHRF
jgi:hypothetical protein